MKQLLCSVCCLCLVILCACAPKQEFSLSDEELIDRAKNFVDLINRKDYDSAVALFETKMALALPKTKLEEIWTDLETQLGAFAGVAGVKITEENSYKCVYLTCTFGDWLQDIKVVFDAKGKISGLWFSNPTSAYEPPEYADTTAFSETEVVIGQSPWELPGTLTVPNGDGPFPCVVLVHGSGPNDRDESIGSNKPFKDIAWGLASNGIAVLRYDKRTFHYGKSLTPEDIASMTVNEETIDDALAALEFVKNDPSIDQQRLYLLCHSMGAMLAPRIYRETVERETGLNLSGLILVAANGRCILDLITEQTEYIAESDGSVTQEELAQIQSIKDAAQRIREQQISEDEIILGASKAYWEDFLEYDPLATAKESDIPMLVLQGERDYQVTMEDFQLWKDALTNKPGVSFKSYPNLNHLFLYGTEKSVPAEYLKPGNVSQDVIHDIISWITSN